MDYRAALGDAMKAVAVRARTLPARRHWTADIDLGILLQIPFAALLCVIALVFCEKGETPVHFEGYFGGETMPEWDTLTKQERDEIQPFG